MDFLTFPALNHPLIRHAFTLRPECTTCCLLSQDEELERLGFPSSTCVRAEQPHGNKVARVTANDLEKTIPAVDALITNEPNVSLIIRTADCGPVFFWDPICKAVGLAHSGRKGTDLNLVSQTVKAMTKHFGSKPEDLIVQLGPCIRPPYYEVDFAHEIQQQVLCEGVRSFYDCGYNTATDFTRFYSYRMECGKTGRHQSAICLKSDW